MTMQQLFETWALPIVQIPTTTTVSNALRGGDHCARTVRAVHARSRTIDGVEHLDLSLEDARAFVTDLDHRFLIADLSALANKTIPHADHEIDLR